MTGKIIAIVGPTASGKSSLGIALARKFNGEIISADSRQVYRGMDLGTGKVSKKEQLLVPHHLLDVASPKSQYTVSQFKSAAQKAIKQIQKRGRVPFIVGGTAFYVYALVDDLALPTTKPNTKLRKSLEKKTTAQLFTMLKKLDPRRAKNIDAKNPRRLVRAIEIVKSTGQPVPELFRQANTNVLLIGTKTEQKKLYSAIDKRVDQRLKAGMVNEVKRLLKQGISHKRLQDFGLEYKFVSLHLLGKLSRQEMADQLKNAIHKFSKRQMTWFKRDDRIKWVGTAAKAQTITKNFLAN